MAESYQTEDEQIREIREWWAKNGNNLMILVIVGLLAFVGARYWMGMQATQSEEASLVFENVMSALEAEDYAGVMDKGGVVLNQYRDTPYADMAAMAMAKAKHDQGDALSAQTYLQWVLDNGKDAATKEVARLRLARLLWSQDKFDEALALISSGDPGSFSPLVEELRGDIYAAKGQPEQARQAYKLALNSPEYMGDRTTLQMKLDDLGGGD